MFIVVCYNITSILSFDQCEQCGKWLEPTDTLSHEISGRRIIIDTKFNSIVTKGWYRDETLCSGYIYQIYTQPIQLFEGLQSMSEPPTDATLEVALQALRLAATDSI